VVTRRALLAGTVAVLAGCGKDEADAPVLPPPVDVLTRQLAAERALRAALFRLASRAPRDDRALVRRLSARSSLRTRRLAVAARAEGGRLYDAPLTDEAPRDPELAVERAHAALAEHVDALPALTGARLRRLGTDLVVESAEDLAMLGAVFQQQTVETFPGTG
jgi:hypothetical protein